MRWVEKMTATYDFSGETVTPDIVTRRQAFLSALRGGDFLQGKGSLCRIDHDVRHCCIGVGCAVSGIPNGVLIEDMEAEYLLFEQRYGVSNKVSRYLMAMNDGDQAGEVGDGFGKTFKYNRTIRHTEARRSFPEIARFLEIIWQLTPTDTKS